MIGAPAPAEAARADRRAWPSWGLAAIACGLLVALNVALQPSLLRGGIVTNVAAWLPLMLVAVGQTWVVQGGDIDLSIGAVVSLVNVVALGRMEAMAAGGHPVLWGLLAGLAVGVGCGVVNGLAVAWLRLQPIVATFATGVVYGGIALWVRPEAGGQAPEALWRGWQSGLWGAPGFLWALLGLALFAWAVSRLPLQTHVLAVGGARAAAYQTGLPVLRVRVTTFALAGLCAAVAALALTAETASADPLMGGALTLSSVSAVVLAGTPLAGGGGHPLAALLGGAVLGLISNVVYFAKFPFEFQTLVQGLIVLAALAGGVLAGRR